MNLQKMTLAFAIACGCLLASSAMADTWSGAYGNTIVATYGDGRVVKVLVEPNHTYSIVLPDGKILRGTWADGSNESCFTVTDPPQPAGAMPTCFPLKAYKVGDTFGGKDPSGSFSSVIKRGR